MEREITRSMWHQKSQYERGMRCGEEHHPDQCPILSNNLARFDASRIEPKALRKSRACRHTPAHHLMALNSFLSASTLRSCTVTDSRKRASRERYFSASARSSG